MYNTALEVGTYQQYSLHATKTLMQVSVQVMPEVSLFIGPTFMKDSLYYRADASLCSLNPVYEAEGNFFLTAKTAHAGKQTGFLILAFLLATPSQAGGGGRPIDDIV